MLDPRVPLLGGLVVTAVVAALGARTVGDHLGISRDCAFRLLVAVGAGLLGVFALLGTGVGRIVTTWEMGQAVGTYVGIVAESWLAITCTRRLARRE